MKRFLDKKCPSLKFTKIANDGIWVDATVEGNLEDIKKILNKLFSSPEDKKAKNLGNGKYSAKVTFEEFDSKYYREQEKEEKKKEVQQQKLQKKEEERLIKQGFTKNIPQLNLSLQI